MSNVNNTVPGEEQPEKKKKETSLMKEILSWVEVIVIALVLAFLLDRFVIVNARVPSGSMENTIKPGDRLLGCLLYTSISIVACCPAVVSIIVRN